MANTPVDDSADFDYESYINNYTGYTRIARSLFIAKQKNIPYTLSIEAYKGALKDIKELTLNTNKYTQVLEQLNALLRGHGKPEVPIDNDWLDKTGKTCSQSLSTLEAQLRNAKMNIDKDKLRVCHEKLGDFYYQTGDFTNALKNYVRIRDYCTVSSQILDMCFKTIKIYIDEGNLSHVIQTYISRAESTPNVKDDVDTITRLRCCQAIATFGTAYSSMTLSSTGTQQQQQQQQSDSYISKYRSIANALTEIPFETASNNNAISEYLSPNDIAIYGALCSLISYNRNELYTKILNNTNFNSFLAMEPHLYELVESFYKSKYSVCFDLLTNRFQPLLKMDMYLAPHHLNDIIELVRERSMVQYCLPYSVIDLRKMAGAFTMEVPELEDTLCTLIGKKGKIAARIDSHRKILRTNKKEKRTEAFEKSIITGEDFEKSTKALLLRINMMKADLIIKKGDRG